MSFLLSTVAVLVVVATMASSSANASTRAPYPYVITTPSQGYYLISHPAGIKVFTFGDDWNPKLLWELSTPYIYPSQLFFAEGGEHLIHFDAWPREVSDTVLVFYKLGKTVAAYKGTDLIVDFSEIGKMSEGIGIQRSKPQFLSSYPGQRFRVVLIDGSEYIFDYDTGKVVAAVKAAKKPQRKS